MSYDASHLQGPFKQIPRLHKAWESERAGPETKLQEIFNAGGLRIRGILAAVGDILDPVTGDVTWKGWDEEARNLIREITFEGKTEGLLPDKMDAWSPGSRDSGGGAVEAVLCLVEWGVLSDGRRKSDRRTVRAQAQLFIVPKSNGLGRAIIDARTLNLRFKAPPKVELPAPPLLWKALNAISTPLSARRMVNGDFSNWFYQIPFNARLSEHCAVAVGNERWFLNVLPMGFSWAPWVGQMLSWGVVEKAISYFRHQWDGYIDPIEGCTAPALRFLREKNGSAYGFVAIYYDGIFIVTNSEEAAVWERALRRTTHDLNCKWKELEGAGGGLSSATFGGLRYFQGGLRVCEGKVDGWRSVLATVKWTRRLVARVVAIVCYVRYVLDLDPGPFLETLRLGQSLASQVASELGHKSISRAWGEGCEQPPVVVLQQAQRAMEQAAASSRDLIPRNEQPAQQVALVITDASLNQGAFVIFIAPSNEASPLSWVQHSLAVDPAGAHATIDTSIHGGASGEMTRLELQTILRGLKVIQDEHPAVTKVVIVNDNQAALHIIDAAWSTTNHLDDLLRPIRTYIRKQEIAVVYIPSALNPMDKASRSTTTRIDDALLRGAFLAIQDQVPWHFWLHSRHCRAPVVGEVISTLCVSQGSQHPQHAAVRAALAASANGNTRTTKREREEEQK